MATPRSSVKLVLALSVPLLVASGCSQQPVADTSDAAVEGLPEVPDTLPAIPSAVNRGGAIQYVRAEIVEGEFVTIQADFISAWPEVRRFREVKGTCKCTGVTMSPMTVSPGETVQVHIDYDSRGRRNDKIHLVAIDDTGRPEELPVVVAVSSIPLLVVDQFGVDFGKVRTDAERTRTIPIRTRVPIDSRAVRFERLPQNVSAHFYQVSSDGDNPLYELQLTLAPLVPGSTLNHDFMLVVPEWEGRDRRFRFTVVGQAASPVDVFPSRLFLGALFADRDAIEKIRVQGSSAVQIVSITGPDWINTRCDWTPISPNEVEVMVFARLVPQSNPPPAGIANVHVATLVGGVPCTVTVPAVYAAGESAD